MTLIKYKKIFGNSIMVVRSTVRKLAKRQVAATRRKMGGGQVNQKSFDSLIKNMLEVLIVVKLHHWNTYSYATHNATDSLYGTLSDHIDKYAEVMIGKSNNKFRITPTEKKNETK